VSRSPLLPAPRIPEDFAARYRAAGYWTPETLDGFLTDRAARHGLRPALIGGRAGDLKARAELSYAELHRTVGRAAAVLRRGGVEPGDRVLVQLPNSVEFVIAIFAAWRLGALPIFSLPAHREHELEAFARSAEPAAYVVAGGHWHHPALDVRSLVDVETWDLTGPGVTDPSAAHAEDVAFLQLSGGTTGTPKLIPRTHADYLYSVRESAVICGVTADTRMLVALPAAHNFPMSSPGILGVLHAGGTVVLSPDPSPGSGLRLVERERITMTSLVPPLLQAWLAASARRRHDLSSLERVQVGGARLAEEVARRVRPELGARLQQVFGMAEGLVCYTRDDDPDDLVLGTQGRPISPDDEVRVVDDDGDPVPDGVEGRLLTRGPYTIRGYYRHDDRSSFDDEGFYRTGDLVRRLPSGHLIVTGRAKDQINRGGEKIAVDEIEGHLLAHGGVHDAALVGVADDYLGERAVAFVIPGEADLSAEALKDFLRERGLASYKIPDRVEFLDAFPSTGVGKTSRRDLRRLLSEQAR